MNESFINKLIKDWELYFFTEPPLILLQFAIIILYLRNKKHNKEIQLFFYYAIAGLLLFLFYEILKISLRDFRYKRHLINEIFNAFFTFTEIFAFSFFYSRILKTKYISSIIALFIILYTTFFFASFLNIFFNNISKSSSNTIFNKFVFVELSFWGLLGLLYFFELFKFCTNENLLLIPSFWIVSFSLIYTLVFPIIFLLLDNFRIENNSVFNILTSLHFISLSLVYAGILKAIICNNSLNKQ